MLAHGQARRRRLRRQEPRDGAAGGRLRRSPGWLLLLAAVVGTAWDALRPGSVALAEHEWTTAASQHADAFTEPLFDFCARTQRDVAPWQVGADVARDRLIAIGRVRRRALGDDGLLRAGHPER